MNLETRKIEFVQELFDLNLLKIYLMKFTTIMKKKLIKE